MADEPPIWLYGAFSVLVTLFAGWLIHMFIAAHPTEARRAGVPWAYTALCGLFGVQLLLALPVLLTFRTAHGVAYLALVLLVVMTIYLCLAARFRRHQAPKPAVTFTRQRWYVMCGLVISLHVALLVLRELWLVATASTPMSVSLLRETLETSIAMFFFAQFTSGAGVRAMRTTVSRDWQSANGRPLPRRQQYELCALPLGMCLLPALLSPGMFAGLLWRLYVLWVGTRYTSLPPAGVLVTLRAAVTKKAPVSDG